LLATSTQVAEMRQNYTGGNYGYGHAKKALLELILYNFAEERKRFDSLMADPKKIESALALGAAKARLTAKEVLQRVRAVLGY
jgi:tryptophanyl-tRNA synthetase